jgi:hypothetical protein
VIQKNARPIGGRSLFTGKYLNAASGTHRPGAPDQEQKCRPRPQPGSPVPIPYSPCFFHFSLVTFHYFTSFTSSLFHFFTSSLASVHCALFTFHSSLFTAFVFQITFSGNSPLYGVQSHETNQLDRFFICCESAFCTTFAAIVTG